MSLSASIPLRLLWCTYFICTMTAALSWGTLESLLLDLTIYGNCIRYSSHIASTKETTSLNRSWKISYQTGTYKAIDQSSCYARDLWPKWWISFTRRFPASPWMDCHPQTDRASCRPGPSLEILSNLKFLQAPQLLPSSLDIRRELLGPTRSISQQLSATGTT